MINNQTKSIRYENIETMCLLLECTPNELFEIRIKDTCFESIGVDTPEDLKRVNDLIKKENII